MKLPRAGAGHVGNQCTRIAAFGAITAWLWLTAVPAAAQDICIACHAEIQILGGLVGDTARARQLTVDRDAFRESVHGRMGFRCTMCHTGVGDYPHGTVQPVQCGGCHASEAREVTQSIHGRLHPSTGTMPATCADCHTDHHILGPKDPRSSVYRLAQFEVCARCHSDSATMASFGQPDAATVRTYLSSVHGRALVEKGLTVAPVCTDCHGHRGTGAHEIQTVADSASPMNRCRVVDTCGRCHAGILAKYDRGIHGSTYRAGCENAPTCTDCHGEHAVQPIASPGSGVNPRHIAQTCTACHDRAELNERYGLPPARGETYGRSFHGIALESGQLTVANCESCHRAHDILPSSDPRSSIYPDSLPTTCGRCHQGIGRKVAGARIHVSSLREELSLLGAAVQWFYVLIIGGFVLYALGMIALDQYRYWMIDRRRGRPHA